VNNDPYHIKITMVEPYYLGADVTGDLIAAPKHVLDPKNLSDKFTFDELNAGDPNHNPAMKQLGDQLRDPSLSFSKQYLIGSGPYMFEKFARNDRVVLVRNPNYWDKEGPYGKAYPDQIIWRSINDYNAALTSLKGGEIDVMPRMEKVQYNNEKDRFPSNHLKPAIYDYPAYIFIGYNLKRPIFEDKLVRLALAHAVDRDLIIKKIYYGMARAVQSPIFYQAKECDTTIPIIKYDLEESKRLLAQAGWKDSDGDGILDKMINGQKVDFRFTVQLNSGNQARKQIALIFVDALKKLGIDAKTTEIEWATFLQRQRAHDFDAYIGGWAMSVTEGDLYQIWHSKSAEEGGSNFGFYKNDRLDQLIESNRTEFDWNKRLANYKEMQKIINDDQPYTFLVSERLTGAYSDRFQGVTFFAPRPCYYAGWWWVPLTAQKYKGSKPVAMN
jgi:ABC-type transport system substrate-binding protein